MSKKSNHEEIGRRIERFKHLLIDQQIDGALMVQKVDLYYFSGTDQDAHLWIPSSDQPVLMVRKSMERALQDTAIAQVVPLTSLSQLPENIRRSGGGKTKRIGLEMDILPVAMYHNYRKILSDIEIVNISTIIREFRMVKSTYEVSCMKKAAEMADKLYQRIPGFIMESDTEIDLAAKAECYFRGLGHPGVTRMRGFNMEATYGHIMAGPTSTLPSNSAGPTGGSGPGPYLSQGPGFNRIGHHEPVIVDYTGNVGGYMSDQTRIFSIGRLKEKFSRAHQVMLEVQEAVSREGKPEARAKDLYALAIRIVEKAGLSGGFMGHPQPVPFIAHGLGLELDEWPIIGKNSKFILEEGMTIALEPKVVFPGEGVVGIENTFVVRDHGLEKLNRFPDEIVIC